jgi:hypothetical protein
MVSVFSAIVFLASYKDIQSVFANPQATMKDQMKNMMGMQNQSMSMDPNQMQTMMMEHMKDPSHMQMMMEQMNKTGMTGIGPMTGMTNK